MAEAPGSPAGRTTSLHLSRAGLRHPSQGPVLRGAPRLRGAPAARARSAGNPARAPEAAAARAVPEPPDVEGNEAAEARPEKRNVPQSRAGRLSSLGPARVALADTRPLLVAGALTSSAAPAALQAAVTAVHQLPRAGSRCYLRSRGCSCSFACATGVAAAGPGCW